MSSHTAPAPLQIRPFEALDWPGVWQVLGGITRPWDFRRNRSAGRSASSNELILGGRTYRCGEIGSFARAQELLRQGHMYLDGNGEGKACESLR